MAAFQRLLIERTGYPRRGSLAELERVSQIPGPMIGRYIRGESKPTDANLRKLAPALGLTFTDLWQVLNPTPGREATSATPPPDPNQVYRLGMLLEEAQKIITGLRQQAVESTIATSRRKRKKGQDNRTWMDQIHHSGGTIQHSYQPT